MSKTFLKRFNELYKFFPPKGKKRLWNKYKKDALKQFEIDLYGLSDKADYKMTILFSYIIGYISGRDT